MTNTPPATERVPWREAIDRIAPASSYGPEKLLDHPAAIDYRMEAGMVEVLVEAPTGDDEPQMPRRADGTVVWDLVDDEPQAETATPEGRWVLIEHVPYWRDSQGVEWKLWDVEGSTEYSAAQAALADLVRRDGTDPTPHEVSSRVAHQVNNGSTESLRLIALQSILDEEGPDALVDAVLAAVRALRDGAAR